MTSIPAAICGIYRNNFKRHYPKNQRHFLDFLILFLKCAWNLELFEKKDEYPSLYIPETIDAKVRDFLNV